MLWCPSVGRVPGAEGVSSEFGLYIGVRGVGGEGIERPGWALGLWGYLPPWVGRAPAPIMFGDLRHSQDVMVVGEPTLMGGEFGDEDERLITRLENTQFDAANGIDDEDSFNNSPALGANSPWNSKPPSSQESKSENPTSQASQ